MRFLLLALAAALVTMPAAASDVFRTVDERGVVIYSDRPLSAASQRVNVDSQPTDPERVAAELDRLQRPDASGQVGADLSGQVGADLEEQRRMRDEACRQAREMAETYERAPRLYENLPDGGRRFLSDEEIVSARQQARQAVADFCTD
jgi:hypothetical protein